MEVILLEDVKALGKKGEVVKVSDGYAKNFILKKKLGVEANSANKNDLKLQKANEAKVAQEKFDAAKALAEELKDKKVVIKIKAGNGDRVFGSISAKEIAAETKKQLGLEIDKKKINKFQITYEEGEFFYLASGYGERPSFGYNIKVNDLYSKGDVLYLDTTLTGPEEGAVVKKAPSYPFIVIKLKASGTDKKVEFIM